VALVVLAIAQMGVHLVFFLHLATGPNTNNVLALAFGVLIVLLVIVGSLWIMANLNHNDADGSAYADAGIELRTISKWSDALLASNSNLNSEDLANHSTSALPTADVPSMGLLTRMYGPAAFRKRDCAWTPSHFMSVRCRTASTTSSVSNLKALNLQFCDQSEASGRPATRSKLVVPDTPNGIPATITMLSPGFPKSPASAAAQASFVIDASSVTSFLTTTE